MGLGGHGFFLAHTPIFTFFPCSRDSFLFRPAEIIIMKKFFALLPVFSVIALVFVSGCLTEPTREEIIACNDDSECICGLIIGTTDRCYVGNQIFIEPSGVCFKLCFGDETRKMKCVDNECRWVSINVQKPGSPVADIIHEEIEENDNSTSITIKNTGPVAFTPVLRVDVSKGGVSVYSTVVDYDTIQLSQSQSMGFYVPVRAESGWWDYNFIVEDSQGSLVNQSMVSYYKEPPPEIDAFMQFNMKPHYQYLTNVTVGVKNIGNMSFVPRVSMTIYKGDMDAIYSDSIPYSKSGANSTVTNNFGIPPLENRTYFLDFVLTVDNTTTVLEHVSLKTVIGT